MLFLSYIRGPQVIQWVRAQINKAAEYVRQNGPQSVYHASIWNDMIQEFATNFQDIMSKECAQAELKQLKMKGGDIDAYNSRFKQLVQNGEYGLNDERTMEQYVEGLPIGLQEAIITNKQTDFLFTWQHWMEAAVQQQKIWMRKQGLRNLFQNKGQGKHPTKQQWQKGFAKDPNAMDTSGRCTHVYAALTEDKHAKLQKEGRCFRCKRQGHLSRNCPDKPKDAKARATGEEESATINAALSSSQTSPDTQKSAIKINTKELVELVHNMDQNKKDKVI